MGISTVGQSWRVGWGAWAESYRVLGTLRNTGRGWDGVPFFFRPWTPLRCGAAGLLGRRRIVDKVPVVVVLGGRVRGEVGVGVPRQRNGFDSFCASQPAYSRESKWAAAKRRRSVIPRTRYFEHARAQAR